MEAVEKESLAKLLLRKAMLQKEEERLLLEFGQAESAVKKLSYDIHELRAKYAEINLLIFGFESEERHG